MADRRNESLEEPYRILYKGIPDKSDFKNVIKPIITKKVTNKSFAELNFLRNSVDAYLYLPQE